MNSPSGIFPSKTLLRTQKNCKKTTWETTCCKFPSTLPWKLAVQLSTTKKVPYVFQAKFWGCHVEWQNSVAISKLRPCQLPPAPWVQEGADDHGDAAPALVGRMALNRQMSCLLSWTWKEEKTGSFLWSSSHLVKFLHPPKKFQVQPFSR